MSDKNDPGFDDSYTPLYSFNELKWAVKRMSDEAYHLNSAKGYVDAIEAGPEPSLEEKKEYGILKIRYLGFFNNKETWFGRKIDFNDPTNVK